MLVEQLRENAMLFFFPEVKLAHGFLGAHLWRGFLNLFAPSKEESMILQTFVSISCFESKHNLVFNWRQCVFFFVGFVYFKRFEVLVRVSNQMNNALKKKYFWITLR